ncbi:TPA: hypothetical protein ACHWKL_004317 [Providencia stuartii]|uniref:hypothetical protein n=1 Tax=Providencia stuartii TaxID=588 RepID=UPI00114037C0|nr:MULTISPECIES: hypothetical protein [Providencia]MBN5563004.1 hypothetical protein [Providencia stuartii]MBN5602996.1 hypothetical protein [Providencia stuartii]MBN5606529.1 hypothetical protein [Providencia stuartii]MCL8327376.1 hypothetical protein [Providencia thailandensis]MDF4176495.1 hypothetical protein [Providencia thailandensis]
MFDINEQLEAINNADFFANMGINDIQDKDIILIENVEKVFVSPSEAEFKGLYRKTEWLPTSPTQDDPFYKKQDNPKELVNMRIKMSKVVMDKTKNLVANNFISKPHDFKQAARNAIAYAFRQYVTEKYFNLGNNWERIIKIYYKGHWPVGIAKEKIIII